jgi:hypothetical protein
LTCQATSGLRLSQSTSKTQRILPPKISQRPPQHTIDDLDYPSTNSPQLRLWLLVFSPPTSKSMTFHNNQTVFQTHLSLTSHVELSHALLGALADSCVYFCTLFPRTWIYGLRSEASLRLNAASGIRSQDSFSNQSCVLPTNRPVCIVKVAARTQHIPQQEKKVKR